MNHKDLWKKTQMTKNYKKLKLTEKIIEFVTKKLQYWNMKKPFLKMSKATSQPY